MYPTTQIAENHITISRPLFNECMHIIENKEYKKRIKKFIFVLVAVDVAMAVWVLYSGGSPSMFLGQTILLNIVILGFILSAPGRKRKTKYKAMCKDKGIAPERTTKFYQDHLSVITDTDKATDILYSEIINWKETKHLYIINCKKNISILLCKDGFTMGTFDSILPLLPVSSES